MSKKKNLLFGISVGLNILLVVIVVWGILKVNLVENTVVHTEIQHNLVELEGLIAHQMDHNWSDPHLVTTKLENVYRGISLGMAIGEPLGILAESDKATLEDLYFNLEQYPRA